MTKAILYARFSPRRNQAECQSIDTQLDICRTYCEKHAYEIVGEPFTDTAISGKTFKRPGLWDAISELKRGYTLVVYSSSRLARNSYLSGYIYDLIERKRAFVDIVDEGGRVATDPMSVCMRQVRAAFDELDRKLIGKRTSDAVRRRAANGIAVSNTPPYGKQWGVPNEIKKDGVLVQQKTWVDDPVEQAVIERIVEMHRDGMGQREIMRALNDAKVPARGVEWSHVTVGRILARHPAIANPV